MTKTLSFENSNIRISDLFRISTRQRRASIRTQRCWVEFRIYYKDEGQPAGYAIRFIRQTGKIFTVVSKIRTLTYSKLAILPIKLGKVLPRA